MGRRSPAAMDGRRLLAGCFSGDGDGLGNKEMKCGKVRKKIKEVSLYCCSLCI